MATLAELDVMIKGDVSNLKTSLDDARDSILRFAGVTGDALGQLNSKFQQLYPTVTSTNNNFNQTSNTLNQLNFVINNLDQSTNTFNNQINNLRSASGGLTNSIRGTGDGFEGLNMILRESHTLGYSMTRGIVSLTYGFTALGKEVNEAKQAGQSWGSIFSTIGSQLFTVQTAVILAGSAVALMAHHMLNGKHDVDEFTKATEDATKAMNDAHGKAAEEGAQLEVLAGMASNAALSMEQRNAAVQKMQDMYPDVLGNLDKEAILTGNIKNELKALNDQLLNKALYEAAGSSLGKYAAQLYDVKTKLAEAKEQQKELNNEYQLALKNTGTNAGYSLEGVAQQYNTVTDKVKDLTGQQDKLQGVMDKTMNDMRNFGQGFMGSGSEVGKILGELNRKMNDLDAITRATGMNEAKEKVSALKSAITELIQAGVQPGNFEIQQLVKQVKDLGGSFEETSHRTRAAAKTIQDVLNEMNLKLKVADQDHDLVGAAKAIADIQIIRGAISQLESIKIPASNTIYAKLFGDISVLEGPLDIQKIHDQIEKQKKVITDLMKKDLESDSRFQHQFNFEEMLGEQGDITLSKVQGNAKKTAAEIKKELNDVTKAGQGIYQVFDSIFTELFTKGTVSFKQIENALGQLIAKLAATVVEAALLSVAFQALGIGGGVVGGSGFGNLLKSLLGGGLKFHAEGGIFTQRTQIGNDVFGEAGPEALIPLKKLPEMMKSILGQSGTEDNANLKNILKSLLSFGNSETKVISKPNAEGKPEITDLNSEKLSGLMNDFSKANTTQQDTSFAGMIKKLFNQPNIKVDVKTDGSTNSLVNNSALSNAINNSSVNNSSNLSNSSLGNSSNSSISNSNSNLSPSSLINPSEISSRISESISEMAKTVMNEEKSSDISSKSVESNISSENIKSVSSEVEGLKNIQNEIRSAVSNSQVANSSLITSEGVNTSNVNNNSVQKFK
jgi:hypothetical protein